MRKLIALILALVMISCALFGCAKKPTQSTGGGGVGLTVDPNQGGKRNETVEKAPNVKIAGFGKLNIKPDTQKVAVEFYNPKENEGLYYLTFELRLKDDSEQGYEVLYKSGLIVPGNYITEIELSRGLPEGEYRGSLYIQPYKMDDNLTPTNNLNSELTIISKNLG